MTHDARSTLTLAARRLRRAEFRVDVLRNILAGTERTSAVHDATLARLKAGERAVFCRRLELESLQKERRRTLAAQPLEEPPGVH